MCFFLCWYGKCYVIKTVEQWEFHVLASAKAEYLPRKDVTGWSSRRNIFTKWGTPLSKIKPMNQEGIPLSKIKSMNREGIRLSKTKSMNREGQTSTYTLRNLCSLPAYCKTVIHTFIHTLNSVYNLCRTYAHCWPCVHLNSRVWAAVRNCEGPFWTNEGATTTMSTEGLQSALPGPFTGFRHRMTIWASIH